MRFIIVTLFPDMFPGQLGFSIASKAMKKNLWSYETININDFAVNKQVDDTEYGGGSGLIIRYDVLHNALSYAYQKFQISKSFYTSPRGKVFNQSMAFDMVKTYHKETILILCGRFEGIDQRTIDEFNLEEISIGNYILSGGEIACITIMDILIRLIPGVIAKKDNIINESFNSHDNITQSKYEHDLYTKPQVFKGRAVPEVLFSGNHKKILEWRRNNAHNK
ncbi:MAG: tRNA (guanosine(37)-N1)-methyltransferase TrmD [Pseudomonadota bacterium]